MDNSFKYQTYITTKPGTWIPKNFDTISELNDFLLCASNFYFLALFPVELFLWFVSFGGVGRCVYVQNNFKFRPNPDYLPKLALSIPSAIDIRGHLLWFRRKRSSIWAFQGAKNDKLVDGLSLQEKYMEVLAGNQDEWLDVRIDASTTSELDEASRKIHATIFQYTQTKEMLEIS